MKGWLEKLPVTAFSCNGSIYYGMDDHLQQTGELPSCLFLAGFDPLMLGYEKNENPFLPPEHMRKIFSLSGIVMPALLMDGQVKGVWKEKGKKVTVNLFEPLTKKQMTALEETARSLWNEKTLVFSP